MATVPSKHADPAGPVAGPSAPLSSEWSSRLSDGLHAIDEAVRALGAPGAGSTVPQAGRFLGESAAVRFHLAPPAGATPVVAIIGGTGTGKSTLLNRLLGRDVSATSFRRTFTAGAVAVVGGAGSAVPGWLGLPHERLDAGALPARGRVEALAVVAVDHPLLGEVTLVDTPDLDGDQPAHHAQADRVFRWAHAVVFLVTPEKYQMTELPPYYRLARRYGVPAAFVMNKADDREVPEDYARQLTESHGVPSGAASVYVVPRDDSTLAPAPGRDLPALSAALPDLARAGLAPPADGVRMRVTDLLRRGRDQLVHPLLDARASADRVGASLRALNAPDPGIDVHPVTQQLQRRLQQRSVLYLIGPQRVFERVRQVPLMLARLPKHTWDMIRHGQLRASVKSEELPDDWQKNGPDFRAALIDQMALLHGRIDDVIGSAAQAPAWAASDPAGHAAWRIDPEEAGKIADEELAALRGWLEARWNADPRDTRVIKALLKVIPGGPKLAKLSEAAPYLLAVVVAAHHSVFGPVDLLVLGGYSLATWLTEKMSNEVAARAKQTNTRLAERFTELARRQVERAVAWVDRQAPPRAQLERLAGMIDEMEDALAGMTR